jgi:hypothetical protein
MERTRAPTGRSTLGLMVNSAIKLKCLAGTEMMSSDWNMPCTLVQTRLERKEKTTDRLRHDLAVISFNHLEKIEGVVLVRP